MIVSFWQPNKLSLKMLTRYMERPNSMAKKGLDWSFGDEGPDRKRPAHSKSTSLFLVLATLAGFWVLPEAVVVVIVGSSLEMKSEYNIVLRISNDWWSWWCSGGRWWLDGGNFLWMFTTIVWRRFVWFTKITSEKRFFIFLDICFTKNKWSIKNIFLINWK